MSRSSPLRLVLLAFCVMACSGCKEGVGTLYPVSGQVSLDGKPLPDGQIAFVPDTEKGNKSKFTPFGKIEGGKFTLTTEGSPGAPAGWYKIMIQSQYPGASSKNEPVPKRYTDPGKSGLSAEVVAGPKADAYDFKMTSQINAPQ
jgi:hypothetical protein